MANQAKAIAIYTSKGETGAYMVYPHLFNTSGEWVGWVTSQGEVYSLLGFYIGFLSKDPRILRKRNLEVIPSRKQVITPPPKFSPPATSPLAPLMPELSYDTIDVLLEFPNDLHTEDAGELRNDMD